MPDSAPPVGLRHSQTIGEGIHERVIIDHDRFMARVDAKRTY